MGKLIKIIQRLSGIERICNSISSLDERLQKHLNTNYKLNQEILAALKFNSTVVDSKWFLNKSISPGESAVNYSFFYTLYRTLSSINPNNILEFGLGQSSKMIHQYSQYYNKKAITVEHDKEWVNFFLRDKGDYNINIKIMDLVTIYYKGAKVLTYKDCKKSFINQKFDLVIVDGPFGYPSDTVYSRLQILDIIQGNISDDFIIIIDDYDRNGEKNTVNEVFDYFEKKNISFIYREYVSVKNHILITTPKNKFLTSL